MELARRAVQLAPNSSQAYHARAIAEWFSGLTEESLATLKKARSLNPNDPELLAETGFRLAMRMEWDAAVPLIEEAYARNPLQTGAYRMGLYFYHFAQGRFDEALKETEAIGAPGVAVVHLARAAALSEMGHTSEGRKVLADVDQIDPSLRRHLHADLRSRQIHPHLIALIVRAIDRLDSDRNRGVRT